ncbi:MAG: hypothetical protein ACO24H_06385 [Polynucleobacter sp.]
MPSAALTTIGFAAFKRTFFAVAIALRLLLTTTTEDVTVPMQILFVGFGREHQSNGLKGLRLSR